MYYPSSDLFPINSISGLYQYHSFVVSHNFQRMHMNTCVGEEHLSLTVTAPYIRNEDKINVGMKLPTFGSSNRRNLPLHTNGRVSYGPSKSAN